MSRLVAGISRSRGLQVRGMSCLLAAAALTLLAGAVQAQPYGRGFVPPPDIDEIMAERLVTLPVDKDELPPNFDWRSNNGVTPVKNQGTCGSCWAFAAAGEMESKIRIYYNQILNLSEQQIISCNPYGSGCGGGWAGAAYYVLRYYGGVLEDCMPYEASDSVPCTQDEYLKFTSMNSWSSIANNLTQIKTAIHTNGPVCTSVDANTEWDNYTGGIITGPGSGTNHLVLIVGWDDRMGSIGAWIVKNSWGSGWGDGGYCYVAYGAGNIGTNVTSLSYTPPAARINVATPPPGAVVYVDDILTLQWATLYSPLDYVDIRYSTNGSCHEEVVELSVPNTGSYEWVVPNINTNRATVLIHGAGSTLSGFGFNGGEFRIVGRTTRYVSKAGSNTAPYDTPATASHTIAAVTAICAGLDSVLVASDNYLETPITVSSFCQIVGGWNADFTVCDPSLYETRVRCNTGGIAFTESAGNRCGVSNITFHNCAGRNASTPVPGMHGAAIRSIGASPVIENCRFENNRAHPFTGQGWGGAIMIHGGSPVIRGSIFTGNIGSHGGAVALSQNVGGLIENCTFMYNRTGDSLATFPGAAVYVTGGTVDIIDSELSYNGAGVGGGLAVAGGAVVVGRDLTITNNRASIAGAGVHSNAATVDLARVRIAGNSNWAGAGAGLYASAGQLQLANVLLAGNQAPGDGGGLYAVNLAGGTVRNNVLHENSGSPVGGVSLTAAGPVAFYNNVISGSAGGGVSVSGAELAADWNVAYQNSGGDFLTTAGEHDLILDPRYAAAAEDDYAPGIHSPLIDSGNEAAGADWDDSPADRGLHGGPLAVTAGPAAVGGLSGEIVDEVEVHLSWTAVDGAVLYVVYRDSAAVFIPSPDLACGTVEAPLCEFQDTPPGGNWYYVVGAVDADDRAGGFSGRYEVSMGLSPVGDSSLPQALAITGVAPNPFNPRTTVFFDLPRASAISLQVYDLRGRHVATLHQGDLPAGRHSAVWEGKDRSGRPVATGIYFVRLQDGRDCRTAKAVLAK